MGKIKKSIKRVAARAIGAVSLLAEFVEEEWATARLRRPRVVPRDWGARRASKP